MADSGSLRFALNRINVLMTVFPVSKLALRHPREKCRRLASWLNVAGHPFFELSANDNYVIIAHMEVGSVRELAAVVRSLRREKGWTQAVLAREAGVGREWVIHLEKARPRVEFGLVMATLKALGVRLNIESNAPVEPDIDLAIVLGESEPNTSSDGHE